MYEIFEKLLQKRNVTAYRVAKETGIATATLSDWKNGKSTPKTDKLQKIADYFGVSLDYLLGNQAKEKSAADSDGLTAKDRRDIARDLERMMTELEESGDLMFDGYPASPEAVESIRQAMAMALEYAKKVNKEKYTPKKYRKQ